MFIFIGFKKKRNNFMKEEIEKSIKIYRTKLSEMNEYLKIRQKNDLIKLEEQSSSIDFGMIKLKQKCDRRNQITETRIRSFYKN